MMVRLFKINNNEIEKGVSHPTATFIVTREKVIGVLSVIYTTDFEGTLAERLDYSKLKYSNA